MIALTMLALTLTVDPAKQQVATITLPDQVAWQVPDKEMCQLGAFFYITAVDTSGNESPVKLIILQTEADVRACRGEKYRRPCLVCHE